MAVESITFNKPLVTRVDESRDDIARMIKAMRDVNQPTQTSGTETIPSTSTSFEQVLMQARGSVDQVNSLGKTSAELKNAYVSGATNVSLTDVVAASQKSDLAFQALLTVRNKLLDAYRQIMDMPV
jgi:flagellar hook-basal body complex protein FliE